MRKLDIHGDGGPGRRQDFVDENGVGSKSGETDSRHLRTFLAERPFTGELLQCLEHQNIFLRERFHEKRKERARVHLVGRMNEEKMGAVGL